MKELHNQHLKVSNIISKLISFILFFLAEGINQTYVNIQDKFYEEKDQHREIPATQIDNQGMEWTRVLPPLGNFYRIITAARIGNKYEIFESRFDNGPAKNLQYINKIYDNKFFMCTSLEFDLIIVDTNTQIRYLKQGATINDNLISVEWDVEDWDIGKPANIRECIASYSETKYHNYLYLEDTEPDDFTPIHQIPLFENLGNARTTRPTGYNIYELTTSIAGDT